MRRIDPSSHKDYSRCTRSPQQGHVQDALLRMLIVSDADGQGYERWESQPSQPELESPALCV